MRNVAQSSLPDALPYPGVMLDGAPDAVDLGIMFELNDALNLDFDRFASGHVADTGCDDAWGVSPTVSSFSTASLYFCFTFSFSLATPSMGLLSTWNQKGTTVHDSSGGKVYVAMGMEEVFEGSTKVQAVSWARKTVGRES